MKLIYKYTFIVLLLLFSCAVKGLPSGGDPDTSGPFIKDITPLNGTKSISLNENIEINFNEMIDPNSVKSSIEVMPNMDVKINSYGKKIHIRPLENWPKEVEFKIKIKRSISDYQGNTMDSGKIITYSTSDRISKGAIKGTIFNIDSTNYCSVGLYEMHNNKLEFYASIENNNNNNFEFKNVKHGEFIIIALINEVRNIYEDIKSYRYGFFSNKIIIDNVNNTYEGINIYISYPKFEEKIVSINMVNRYYGEMLLTNNEKIMLIDNSIDINYSDSDSYIIFNNESDSIIYNTKNFIEKYELVGRFELNTTVTDSLPPAIIDSYFKDGGYQIEFSEAIKIKNNLSPFSGLNSNGDSVYCSYEYFNPKVITLKDISEDYSDLTIDNLMIIDYSNANNQLIDNKIHINHLQSKKNKYGNIHGNIIYNGDNEVIVEIIDIKSNKSKRNNVDKQGNFVVNDINPGMYQIWAYENINSISNYYFNGTLDPLKLSAQFGIYNGIIEIRSNWDIEGITIVIKKHNE